MRFGERFGRARVVPEMRIHVVATIICSSDGGDGPVGDADLSRLRHDTDDRAFGNCRKIGALADADEMAAAIPAVDDQIMTVGMLVGEPAGREPPDQGRDVSRARIVDRLIDRRTIDAARGEGTLHRADNVAALADLPQRPLEIARQLPDRMKPGQAHPPPQE